MPLRGDEPADLYEIIRLRYERRAIIITSNRGAAEWPGVFGDPLLASAAVDRLRHHAHIIEIDGPSFRDPRAHIAARARRGSVARAGGGSVARARGGSVGASLDTRP